MADHMELRTLGVFDPLVTEYLTAGAIPADVMPGTWKTMQQMKDLARRLPPYAPGTDPQPQAPTPLLVGSAENA